MRFWSSALQLLREVAVQCASRSGTCTASAVQVFFPQPCSTVAFLRLPRAHTDFALPFMPDASYSSQIPCEGRGPFSPQARHGHQRWPWGCPCRFCRARGACARGFEVESEASQNMSSAMQVPMDVWARGVKHEKLGGWLHEFRGRYLPQAGKSKAPYRSTAPCAALKAHGASLPRLWESGKATFLSLKYFGTTARVQSHWQQRIHQEQHAGCDAGPTHKVQITMRDEGSCLKTSSHRKWMSYSCKSSIGRRLSNFASAKPRPP